MCDDTCVGKGIYVRIHVDEEKDIGYIVGVGRSPPPYHEGVLCQTILNLSRHVRGYSLYYFFNVLAA